VGWSRAWRAPAALRLGFTQYEYSTSGKWLELLKEIVPEIRRAAVLRDSTTPSGLGQFAAIQSAAVAFGLEVRPMNVLERDEIERAVAAFASEPNGGLIVAAGAGAVRNRDLIIALARRYRLPAIFNQRSYVTDGGLVSYGPDLHEQWRLAAVYVDRILKGEKPGDLPVQAPTKYEMVVNLKTAKALGLEIPSTVLARADEVIE
jgi:putative tryptophan/tyrosine transport system substrate-binding protein